MQKCLIIIASDPKAATNNREHNNYDVSYYLGRPRLPNLAPSLIQICVTVSKSWSSVDNESGPAYHTLA